MNIRSIRAFVDASYPLDSGGMAKVGGAAKALRDALKDAGITVQTMRLAIQPFAAALGANGPDKLIELAKDMQAIGFVHEFDYLALGPARLDGPIAYVEALPGIIAETDNVFVGVEIATAELGIDLARVRRAASLIRRVA